MKKRRVICVALLGLAGAVAGVVLMLYGYARADVLGGPLPAPRLPRDIIQLTPVEELGKLILYDRRPPKGRGSGMGSVGLCQAHLVVIA
jgi:hypothetical protein